MTVYLPCKLSAAGRLSTLKCTTYRWDLLWQVNVLGESHVALLERALEVDFRNRVAEVVFLVDEGDEAVFDLDVYFCALFNLLLEIAGSLDGKSASTMSQMVSSSSTIRHVRQLVWRHVCMVGRLRYGRVRRQVNRLELQNVVLGVRAKVQRVVTRHAEVLVDGHLARHPAGRRGNRDGAHSGHEECRSFHVGR
jgi:hypothetical protein